MQEHDHLHGGDSHFDGPGHQLSSGLCISFLKSLVCCSNSYISTGSVVTCDVNLSHSCKLIMYRYLKNNNLMNPLCIHIYSYTILYQDYLPKELAALVVNVSFNPRNCELMLNNKV